MNEGFNEFKVCFHFITFLRSEFSVLSLERQVHTNGSVFN